MIRVVIPDHSCAVIPYDERFIEIHAADKTAIYYFVIIFFLVTTVAATLMTSTFLVLSVFLWKHFKHIRFFWFLIQLLISVFIISAANMLIHVPASLGLLTQKNLDSEIFIVITYLIDFCHYSILFSNTVIAINRGVVFFKKASSPFVRAFEPPFIFIWLLSIWIITFAIEYILLSWRCRFELDSEVYKFQMKCEYSHGSIIVHSGTPIGIQMIDISIHIVLPILILAIYVAIILKLSLNKSSVLKEIEKTILKQALFVFVVFQAPSLIFIGSNVFIIQEVTGFLIKRFVNTLEIFGGIATPSFFFFTSQEVRKLMSAKIHVTSSEGDVAIIQRRQMGFPDQ